MGFRVRVQGLGFRFRFFGRILIIQKKSMAYTGHFRSVKLMSLFSQGV